jgi:hypothetical protein
VANASLLELSFTFPGFGGDLLFVKSILLCLEGVYSYDIGISECVVVYLWEQFNRSSSFVKVLVF